MGHSPKKTVTWRLEVGFPFILGYHSIILTPPTKPSPGAAYRPRHCGKVMTSDRGDDVVSFGAFRMHSERNQGVAF